jgi:hypothetical protein
LDIGSPNLAGDVQESSLIANLNYVGLSNFTQLPQGQSGRDLTLSLSDPQSLNSYAYVENNPIKNVDPNGRGTSPAAYVYGTTGNSPMFLPAIGPQLAADAIVAGVRSIVTNPAPYVIGGLQNSVAQIAANYFQGVPTHPLQIAEQFVIGAGANKIAEGYGLVRKLIGTTVSTLTTQSLSGQPLGGSDLGYNLLGSSLTYGYLNSGSTVPLSRMLNNLREAGLELNFSIGVSAAKATYNNANNLPSPTALAKYKEAGLVK